MKKIISGILMLGLVGIAVLYMNACAKQSGPLSPSLNLIGSNNSFNKNFPYVTGPSFLPSGPLAVSQCARLYFNMQMEAASFNTSTVLVYTQDDANTTETQYPTTAYTVSYNNTSWELTIAPVVAWTNNKAYRVIVTTGVRSAAGNPLDQNQNNLAEGDAFDAYQGFLNMGTPTSAGYTSLPNYIKISDLTCTTNYGSGIMWSTTAPKGAVNTGALNANATYVTVTAQLTMNSTVADPHFAFDPANINKLLFTAAATGVAVTPIVTSVTCTATGYLNDTLIWVFSLAPSVAYNFQLLGGAAGIRSIGAPAYLMNSFYFDGNANDKAEASDDSKIGILTTEHSTGTYPSISLVESHNTTLRYFKASFTVDTGDGTLNSATVNSSNFKLLDVTTGTMVVPASVVLDNAVAPTPAVYVYVPQRFINSASGDRDLKLVVMRYVTSSNGVKLAVGLDGVPGNEDDDYISASGTGFTNY